MLRVFFFIHLLICLFIYLFVVAYFIHYLANMAHWIEANLGHPNYHVITLFFFQFKLYIYILSRLNLVIFKKNNANERLDRAQGGQI